MKKKVLSLIALGALTLLWSCSNGFEERVGQVHSSDGKTYLVIDSASVASRSVNPGESDTDTSKLTDFVLKGTPENGSETELATTDSLAELKEKQIEIITGNWSFTLTAKLYGIDFSGTTTAEIKVGEINSISFELKSVQTYGGINITVVFDADPNLTEVVATLKNPDKSSITGIEPITVEKADFTEIKDDNDEVTEYSVTYSRSASIADEHLASGSYYLVFDFYAEGTVVPINSISYVVNIADGITTTYSQTVKLNETYTITYFLDGSELEPAETRPEKYSRKSETVTLPTMSKEDYAFAGWYTDNEFTSPITEIPTGSTGNIKLYACFINSIIVNAEGTADANVAAGEAVDSITTALGKIQSYATVIDWTILIDGKVEGTTTLGLQDMYATSLTIMGAHKNTDENYTDILDGGSVFAETQAGATIKGSIFTVYNSCVPITIKNLKITHGNSSRGYGGAFDTNGTVTLDDGTWITDNHTYYDGGAIMNTDNATLTIKAGVRIDNNSASDSGGAIRNAGTLIIEGGEIMDNTSGRTVIQQEGTMIIKGSPIFGEGQNIGLAAYYPFTASWVTVDGELDEDIPAITIKPGNYTNYNERVILKMADDSALSEATLSKFVVPADSGGIQWIIDAEGKLVRKAATGTGTVTTDNNVLSIALKYEDETVNTNEVYMIKAALESDTPVLPLQRRISITVKDADGNDVSDATVTAKILYHGNEVSPSYYSYEEGYFSVNPSMPLLNSDGCQLYVTATKETITSSQTFDVGFGCFFYGDITNDSESLASFITNAAEVSAPLYMKVTDSGNNIEDFFGRISSLSNVYLDLFELTYITNFNSEIFISECPGIVSLSLPNSTTTISESAFTKTPNLAYIMIPASVTTISSGAFPSPNVIQKITLADGITGFSLASNGAILVSSSGEILCVANGAKNSITTLDFSAAPLSSVTKIPANAFIGLASLTSITSFGNVTTIGDYAFAVSKLSGTVDLSKVQNIGQLAFARTKISGVTLNETDETTIAKQAFAYSEISSVTLPATTKFTPTEVDESDPEHIRYTYNEAFYNCMNLKTVTIAAGLTEEINHSMFERCLNLEKYVISGSGGDYTTMADGAFLVKGNTLICAAQAGIPETIDFTDTGITKIGISAFEGNPDLEPEERKSFSVTNFGSVTTIGDSAFNASGITAIGEFGSVTSIGEYAFAYAPLTSISAIKEGMSIGSFAFYNTKLTELTIASAKVKTGGSAFGSSQIAKVTLDFVIDYNDATDYAEYLPDDYDRNGDTNKYSLDYFISRNMLSSWCGFSDVKELVLNKTVNLRDYYADPTLYDPDDDVYSYTPTTVDGVHYERPFSELYKTLEKLTINGAGSYIGDYQFHKFEKLETVSFGGTNISIGDYAFANTGLGGQTVVINDSITAIGNCAFLNTPAIETSIDGTGTWYYASAKDVWKDAITNSGAGVEEPDWTSIGTVSDAGADIISKIAVTEAPSTSVYLYNKKAE